MSKTNIEIIPTSRELSINGNILKTPAFFPVVAFYCGGSEHRRFGGGIYKYIKEYLSDFDTALGNVSHFLDFWHTEEKVNHIMEKTVKEWFGFKGVLIIDSGGYKLLTLNAQQADKDKLTGYGGFSLKTEPETILNYQVKMGADIATTLDFPISPNINKIEMRKRIKKSSEYANQAKTLAEENGCNVKIYASIHGHQAKDILYCLNNVNDGFDGYAIGSLVPIKNDYKRLIDIVLAVRSSIPPQKPLHVFGITGSMMPILSILGADTFDSATYVHAGRFRKYILKDLRQVPVTDLSCLDCDCKICRNYDIEDLKRPGSESAALIAMHNYYVFKDEMEEIRHALDSNGIEEHIINTFTNNKKLLNAFEYAKEKINVIKIKEGRP